MRYFLGIYDAAGYLDKLSTAFKNNGIKIRYVNLGGDLFSQKKEKSLYKIVCHLEQKCRERGLIAFTLKLLVAVARILMLLNELFRSDVFIFSGYDSFLRFYDLKVLKLFNKKVIVVYLGSDGRPPFLSGIHKDEMLTKNEYEYLKNRSLVIHQRIKRVEKWADQIINHTGGAQYFSKPFIKFCELGLPYEGGDEGVFIDIPKNLKEKRRLKLVHIPSRPVAKGSSLFSHVIDRLKSEGYQFDYETHNKIPHKEVMSILGSADILLDEAYSDVPLGMLGVEAASLGKAVISSGYYKDFYKDNPSYPKEISVYCEPHELIEKLRSLLSDECLRFNYGSKAKKFVREQCDPNLVASKMLRVIHGCIPLDWIHHPCVSKDYIFGAGIDKESLRLQVSGISDYRFNAYNHSIILRRVMAEIN